MIKLQVQRLSQHIPISEIPDGNLEKNFAPKFDEVLPKNTTGGVQP